MARYTGSVCRLCRRDGVKLYLKGDRCYSDKCPISKGKGAPGQHGARKSKLSDFGQQLREKQKLRRIYGVLEAQFRRYFGLAATSKGRTGQVLVQTLELRLDSVVFRLGWASSRSQARQFVRHNHVLLNGSRCNIPSVVLSVGDKLSLSGDFLDNSFVTSAMNASRRDGHNTPSWLKLDDGGKVGEVVSAPPRDEIHLPVQEKMIVELYSK